VQALISINAFSLSHSDPQEVGWGGQEAGRAQSVQLTPAAQRDTSTALNVTLSNSSRVLEGGEGFVFCGSCGLRDYRGIGLLLGGKRLPLHHSFLSLFPLLTKLSLYQPINFLAFFLPILFSALLGG